MATRRAPRDIESRGDEHDSENWGAVPANAGATADADEPQTPMDRVLIALETTADLSRRNEIKLYRIVPGGPGKPDREEWCSDLSPEEFEAGGLEHVRTAWGPGTYEVRLLGSKPGSRHFTRLAQERFTLAPLPTAVSALTGPGSGAMAGVEGALRALAEGQARLAQALIDQRSAPAPDPMQQMQQMLTMMVSMREAMGLTQTPPAPQKSSIAEIVEAIQELKGVAEIVSPPSKEDKSDVERLVEMAAPLVTMAQSSMQQRQTAPVVTMPPVFQQSAPASLSTMPLQSASVATAASAASDASASSSSASENADEAAAIASLHDGLAQLLRMADESADVEKAAEFVYEKIPDEMIEIMAMPVWWTLLTNVAPDVAKHEKWMHAVRDRALRMFDEGDDGNDQSTAVD